MQGILTYAKAYQLFFQLSQLSFKRYYLCLQAFPLLHSWRFLATPHIFWVNLSWNILHNSVLPNIFVFASVADECLAYVSWKHTSHISGLPLNNSLAIWVTSRSKMPWICPSQSPFCQRSPHRRGNKEGIRWEVRCVKPVQWFMLVQNSWSKGLESPSRTHTLHL